MKTTVGKLFLFGAFVTHVGFMTAGATAQTFQTLHSFSELKSGTNSDGAAPIGGLIAFGKLLYGTAQTGGSSSNGTLFAIKTDGSGFTNLHNFTGPEGAYPSSDLILSGRLLYGTTAWGGDGNAGTIFQINTDGTGFADVHQFVSEANNGTAAPLGPLVLASDVLYGSSVSGGIFTYGTIYAVNLDGAGFTNLFIFSGGQDAGYPNALVLSGNTLYGTTAIGGSPDIGTVFTFDVDHGTTITPIHNFSDSSGTQPRAGLTLSNNTLYGTTCAGGSGSGSVFSLQTDGTGFAVLHIFAPISGYGQDQYMWGHETNSDGAFATANVILSGSTLYGTTYTGGAAANGTVFAVNTDGTGFTNLHVFTPLTMNTNGDGANPRGGLILLGQTLYGTTIQGGTSGNGTVFSISLSLSQPQLAISLVAGNAILSWPASSNGFSLQTATNLASPVWSTNLPPPVVANGRYVMTNSISGAQRFFRLSQ